MKTQSSFKSIINPILIVIGVIALAVRFFHITSNDFIFYDEGMYLAYNRAFLNLVSTNPPHNISEFLIILNLIFKTALATPKALWFFLINTRVFTTGVDGYYFSRVVSALCGVAAVGVTFIFAKKYFKSTAIAVLSAVILALLPSHVFYARQGMQEAICGLLFLAGIYCYVFGKKGSMGWVIASAVCMFAVFLTNYRMIIAPLFILVCAAWDVWINKQSWDIKKMAIFLGIYAVGFAILGVLENGINLKVNAAWMLNQAGESGQYRQWYNFLSFPYYLLKLENVIFGVLFFVGFYWCYRRRFAGLLPFFLVVLQMGLFSFAAEKGARYLCVVLPFAAMSVAGVIYHYYQTKPKYVAVLTAVMLVWFVISDIKIAVSTSAYEEAIAAVKANDPQSKMLTTQPVVEKLFVANEIDVMPLPKSFEETGRLVKEGYRYLIIDPQLYISWTKDEKRFSLEELDFIRQLRLQAPLRQRLTHFNDVTLERFVLDHNQDLLMSLRFLQNSKDRSDIYIYDLGV